MTISLNKKVLALGALVVAIVLTAVAIVMVPRVYAAITYTAPTLVDTFVTQSLLNATSTTATSTNSSVATDQKVRLDGAKQATFSFSRTGNNGNAGASKFEVEVSQDGSTWVDFPRLYLLDTAKTASSTVWIIAATTTVMASMDLEVNAFRFARCQVVEVTDGEHSCSVSVEY